MAYITPESFPVRKKGGSPQRVKADVPVEARSEGFLRDAALFHGADSRAGTRDQTTFVANEARFHGSTPQSTKKPSNPAESTQYVQAREKFYGVTPAETAQRQTSHSLDKARKQFYGDS
jgi:hypothetical protein